MGKANFGIVLNNPHEPVLAGTHLKGEVWAQVDSEIKVSHECIKDMTARSIHHWESI
jgi:hypothetical protein